MKVFCFFFAKKKALLFEKLRIARGDRESKNFLSVGVTP
jgi:hypothetical protein